jgi:hypothetical protein
MIIKNRFVIAILLMISTLYGNNIKTIKDNNGYKYINISKSDTSRIECKSGEIGEIIYSKDKEITVEKSITKPNNAFIKLKQVVGTSNGVVISKTINTFNREIYLECGKKLYSFILVPKDITAQTIIIKSNNHNKQHITMQDVKKAQKFEKAKDYETTLLNLIRSVYKEEIPTGYSVVLKDKVVEDFQELTLIDYKVYVGSHYSVHEYIINAKKLLSNLEEKTFLDYIDHPLAIAITKYTIKPYEKARLLVVSNNHKANYTIKSTDKIISNAIKSLNLKRNKESIKYINNEKLITNRIKKFIGEK